MTTHTDRIRQMAQEAGIQSPEQYDGHSQDCPWMATTDELTRFAQLVAEDCARVAEERHAEGRLMALAREGWDESALAAYAACADGMGVDIRARYSLKGE